MILVPRFGRLRLLNIVGLGSMRGGALPFSRGGSIGSTIRSVCSFGTCSSPSRGCEYWSFSGPIIHQPLLTHDTPHANLYIIPCCHACFYQIGLGTVGAMAVNVIVDCAYHGMDFSSVTL